jgi:hypothetical protein
MLVLGLVATLGLTSATYSAERSDRPSERGKEGPAERPRDGTDGPRYSDRARKGQWEKGKDELVRALKPGQDRDFYRKQLEKLGYQITAVNSDKADYVEYEVVKGDRSYEVQIDIDKNSSKATKVDIDTNVWKAAGTERALETKQAKSTPAKREREKTKTSDR